MNGRMVKFLRRHYRYWQKNNLSIARQKSFRRVKKDYYTPEGKIYFRFLLEQERRG